MSGRANIGLSAVLAGALLSGCGGGEPTSRSPVPERVRWEAVEGATRYTLRAFSGDRLLFEESTAAIEWALDPATRRACAPFDTIMVVVRAQGVQAPAQRLRIRP